MNNNEYKILKQQVLNNTISKMINGSMATKTQVMGNQVFLTDVVVQSDGAQWGMYEWFNRGLRMASKQMQIENTRANARAYGWDLVFVNYTANASHMCIDFQNKIYSESGESKEYPPLDDVTWSGSGIGLFHPNCYHYTNIYFGKASDALMQESPASDSSIELKAEGSKEKRNVERNIRKYQRRIELKKENGIDYEDDLKAIREWRAKPHDEYRIMGYYGYEDEKFNNTLDKAFSDIIGS